MTNELIEQIMMAHNKMLKENGRPQVVVLNDALFEKEPVPNGQIPMVCGMKVVYAPLQRHIHFIIKESFTNADRIRSMTDEELADAFAMISDCISCNCRSAEDDCSIADGTCQRQWLEWLKQEAVDNGACSADETSEKVQDE